jgi:hypothetical protein
VGHSKVEHGRSLLLCTRIHTNHTGLSYVDFVAYDMSAITAFQTGDDFISFNTSPTPEPAQAHAGPSKLPTTNIDNSFKSQPPTGPKSDRAKGKARESLDDDDASLLAKKNGRRVEGDGIAIATSAADDGKKGKKGKGKEKEKEKDRGPGTRPGKRGRDGDDEETGPRNLKEERRAAERGAPWVGLVDWGACRDPADM